MRHWSIPFWIRVFCWKLKLCPLCMRLRGNQATQNPYKQYWIYLNRKQIGWLWFMYCYIPEMIKHGA